MIGDSLNSYNGMQSLTAKSPEELIAAIRAIKTPIKIISIVSDNNRYTCFFLGDVIIKRKPKKEKINGNNN